MAALKSLRQPVVHEDLARKHLLSSLPSEIAVLTFGNTRFHNVFRYKARLSDGSLVTGWRYFVIAPDGLVYHGGSESALGAVRERERLFKKLHG